MTLMSDANLPRNGRPLGYATAEAEGHDNVVYDQRTVRAIGLPHYNLVLAIVEELHVLSFGVCPDVELQSLCVIFEPVGKLSERTSELAAACSEDNGRLTF